MSTLSTSIPSINIKTTPSNFTIRTSTFIKCSQADGPLRRPSAPSLAPPPSSPPLSPPPAKTSVASQIQNPTLKKAAEPVVSMGVTLEYQRKIAKELQDYFKQRKLDEAANRGPSFGFIAKNEIANGRWAMFGFAVGLLTEYATGSDFVQQLKILLSNFGIVDLD